LSSDGRQYKGAQRTAKTPGHPKVEVVTSPSLEATRELLAYWRSKCPVGGLPGRDEIVPHEIRRLLPHLLIIEPINGGADWVFRLVGTATVFRHGTDATGMRVREVFPSEVADAYIADYQRGVANRAPWIVHGNFVFPGKEHVRFESVGLPILGRDGVTVWLLIGLFYFN